MYLHFISLFLFPFRWFI